MATHPYISCKRRSCPKRGWRLLFFKVHKLAFCLFGTEIVGRSHPNSYFNQNQSFLFLTTISYFDIQMRDLDLTWLSSSCYIEVVLTFNISTNWEEFMPMSCKTKINAPNMYEVPDKDIGWKLKLCPFRLWQTWLSLKMQTRREYFQYILYKLNASFQGHIMRKK